MTTGLLTIVDDYIDAAVRQAVVFVDGDGFVVAHIEGEPGVRAHGETVEECRDALVREIEDWVGAWLAARQPLPVFDAIDLNAADSRVLARNHRYAQRRPAGLEVESVFETGRAFIDSLPT